MLKAFLLSFSFFASSLLAARVVTQEDLNKYHATKLTIRDTDGTKDLKLYDLWNILNPLHYRHWNVIIIDRYGEQCKQPDPPIAGVYLQDSRGHNLTFDDILYLCQWKRLPVLETGTKQTLTDGSSYKSISFKAKKVLHRNGGEIFKKVSKDGVYEGMFIVIDNVYTQIKEEDFVWALGKIEATEFPMYGTPDQLEKVDRGGISGLKVYQSRLVMDKSGQILTTEVIGKYENQQRRELEEQRRQQKQQQEQQQQEQQQQEQQRRQPEEEEQGDQDLEQERPQEDRPVSQPSSSGDDSSDSLDEAIEMSEFFKVQGQSRDPKPEAVTAEAAAVEPVAKADGAVEKGSAAAQTSAICSIAVFALSVMLAW